MSGIGIVIVDAVEVRETAAADGSSAGRLLRGQRARVEELVGDWVRVQAAEGAGFVPAGALALLGVAGEDLLAATAALQEVDLEPPADQHLEPAGGREDRAVCRSWNLYGGLLAALSAQVGIDPGTAVAVLCVESAGQGFGRDGRMIIRFENHVFRRQLGAARREVFDRHFRVDGPQSWQGHHFRASPSDAWRAFHGSQDLEWQALAVARGIDDGAALRSISMGAPQIMGFNHAAVGYPTVQAMFEFFAADARFQVLGLFDFLRGGTSGHSPMLDALRRQDYDAFATRYNGPGQAQHYGDLIARHVEAFHRVRGRTPEPVEPTPAEPAGTEEDEQPVVVAAGTYTVRSGDTLSGIAGRFGVPLRALVEANDIANPDLIRVGQVLTIPEREEPPPPPVVPSQPADDVDEAGEPLGEQVYVVRRGDTLSRIASRFGVTVAAIVEANSIPNPDRIFPGQVFVIPSPGT